MYCARVKKSELPEPYQSECDKTILVIGGGAAGLSAALEAANSGYDVVLVEKQAELGGYGAKLHRQTPSSYPFTTLQEPTVFKKIREVQGHPKIRVFTSAQIEKIDGQPGLLDTTITVNGSEETFRVGSVVMAAGGRPYDASKLTKLGYGLSKDVITNLEMEELARKGQIVRPSDGKPANTVALSNARFPGPGASALLFRLLLSDLPEAGPLCPPAESQRLGLYPLQGYPHPGATELFYKEAQSDPGVMLTKAEIEGIALGGDGRLQISAKDTLLGDQVLLEADLVVLATGMVPVTNDEPVLNLTYRQGPGLPEIEPYQGFADSNFICFPYETRRTGVYAGAQSIRP